MAEVSLKREDFDRIVAAIAKGEQVKLGGDYRDPARVLAESRLEGVKREAAITLLCNELKRHDFNSLLKDDAPKRIVTALAMLDVNDKEIKREFRTAPDCATQVTRALYGVNAEGDANRTRTAVDFMQAKIDSRNAQPGERLKR